MTGSWTFRTLIVLGAVPLSACRTPSATSAAATAGWTISTAPSLPEPLSNNAVAAAEVDGRVRVLSFLGIGASRDYTAISRRAYALDVSTGVWERLPDVPGPAGRLAATAEAVGGQVYLFGGYEVAADATETTSPAVDIYDIRERRYTRGRDAPTPVDDAVSGVWRGRLVYLVGGWSMDRTVRDVQFYDPRGDAWSAATSLTGTPVFGHSGALVRDTIVYCGGAKMNAPAAPKYLPSAECHRGDIDASDPSRVDWKPIAALPGLPRYRMAAGPVDAGDMVGVLFVGGTTNPYNFDGMGYDGRPSAPEAASWLYDVEHDRWLPGPTLAAPTMDHRGAVQGGGSWFVIGGMEAGQRVTSRVTRLAR